jgi:hypothetical protein
VVSDGWVGPRAGLEVSEKWMLLDYDVPGLDGASTFIAEVIIIIIIFINCNWVITRWQWLFYIYRNMNKK